MRARAAYLGREAPLRAFQPTTRLVTLRRLFAMDLSLLLFDDETDQPALPEGLPLSALDAIPREPPDAAMSKHLFSDNPIHFDDLKKQRWGLIVPEHGAEESLRRLAPLIEQRAQQQGI